MNLEREYFYRIEQFEDYLHYQSNVFRAFCFTQKEVDEMLAFYDRSDFADLVKKWYDGYREVLCYGIAFYKKNCKITVERQKIEL